MKVKDSLEGEVAIIALGGKIIVSDELTSFHGRIHYYLSLNKTRFVIDLKDVEWMSSAGLGALVSAHVSAKKAGGKMVLANITNIENLLNITQLIRVFEVCDSRAEAVKSAQV
jgi:anti-anti-sigma factor